MKRTSISGIYIITNLKNNKIYVGKSVNCLVRINVHKSKLRRNIHNNHHLQSAWNTDKEEYFKFEILEVHEKEFLSAFENWWCNMLNVHDKNYGYNMQPTVPFGASSNSLEIRNKISISNKGKRRSEEVREKLSIAFTGRVQTEETKELLRNTKSNKSVDVYQSNGEFFKNYKSLSECSRELSINIKSIRRSINGEGCLIKNCYICKSSGDELLKEEIIYRNNNSLYNKGIKIIGHNLDGTLVGEFNSTYEAGKITGLDSRGIRYCISGKRKIFGDIIWKKII